MPTIPAILNAVYDATGIRFQELPMTPERVFMALRAKKQQTKGKKTAINHGWQPLSDRGPEAALSETIVDPGNRRRRPDQIGKASVLIVGLVFGVDLLLLPGSRRSGTLRIVDGDEVALNNLNRQILHSTWI